MAYQGSKGWYVQELKKIGITKHPVERRKIELYKTFILRNLYLEKIGNTK
ncbi:YflJ family protein [Neobacillus pocheonensis]